MGFRGAVLLVMKVNVFKIRVLVILFRDLFSFSWVLYVRK